MDKDGDFIENYWINRLDPRSESKLDLKNVGEGF